MIYFIAGLLIGSSVAIFFLALLHDDDTTRGHPL